MLLCPIDRFIVAWLDLSEHCLQANRLIIQERVDNISQTKLLSREDNQISAPIEPDLLEDRVFELLSQSVDLPSQT